MKKQKILIIFLSLFSLLSVYGNDQDSELARLYARHAWDAYEHERWSDFSSLTEKGLEYDDQNPDLLSFKGLQAEKKGMHSDAAEWFSKAFYSGYQPEQVNAKDILAWLAEVHYRLGNDEALESLFYTIDELTKDDPDIHFYTVLSLYRQGSIEQALQLASDGVYRYQDQRFLILLSSWMVESPYPGILSEYIRRQGLLYPDLMARTILSDDSKNKLALASLYLEQFNDLNSWYFRVYLFNEESFSGSVPDFTGGSRIWPILTLQSYIEMNPDMGRLMGNIRKIALDSTGDGIADIYLKGHDESVVWEIDPDQDGIIDSHLVWNDNDELISLRYRDDRETRHFQYYKYPFIDKIVLSGINRNLREYYYLPGGYSHSLTEDAGNLHIQLLMNPGDISSDFLPESDILKNSFSLIDSVTRPRTSPFREYTVVDGIIRRFREDSNFDGKFDRIVLLNDWLPYEGYRDIDGNGEFDLKEKYIAGRFAGFVYEGEKSRIEEYQDLWNRKRYQLWDFSRNGFYDALLEQSEDSSWKESLIITHETGEE